MAVSRKYLVPLDFSKSSEVALKHAVKLIRAGRRIQGALILLHVITDPARMVPINFRDSFYSDLEKEAKARMEKLVRRHGLGARQYRFVVLRGRDAAGLIAAHAKKARVAMIVMGNQGRTGLSRLILGSVAEKTLRHAPCPVLIVKK